MNTEKRTDLYNKITELILSDPRYNQDDWRGIGIAVTLDQNRESCSSYRYFADGTYEAGSPKQFGTLFDLLLELREHIQETEGRLFVQCLIHLTKPDNALHITYEYKDPARWSLKKISADTSDFAEQLRPDY